MGPDPSSPAPGAPVTTGILAGGGEMGDLARRIDWGDTPVGPVEAWPQSLRTSLSMLLASRFPMLLCWGPDFVQFYNDPFRPILGVSKHPALGRSTRDTFAEAWHIVGPLFEQVMQGRAVGFEDMLVPLDRNGFLEECYFHYSYSPIRDETGCVGGVLVICTETTGRVLAERRLGILRELASQAAQVQDERAAWTRASEILATSAIDVPFSLLYALAGDGSTATLVCGMPAPSFGPPTIRDGDDEPAWPLFQAAAAAAPQVVPDVRRRMGTYTGPVWPEPIDAAIVLPVTRPGLTHPYGFLVAGVSPRLALDDKYRDFLALVADQIATAIAHARAYEEERTRAQALVELDRQKTAFFSNVSHEFRTPLTLLLGPIEEALGRSPAVLHEGEVALVHRNAVRLLRLVNTLLDFSRIEAGRAHLTLVATDLAALTRDLAGTFRSLVEQAGIQFEIDCPPLAAAVPVDPGMWEKVVLNLLSNAFKFTLRGRITVRLRETADRIELEVEDTGAGIPASELPHVFDRFHRVAGTPSRTFEGSGIGLALVRELARMHGGDVSVTSVEGQGTTFTVTLPSRRATDIPLRPAATAAPAAAALPYLEEARRWTGDAGDDIPTGDTAASAAARILVVDDNADMRDYLRRLLGERWTVEVAANGREALDRIGAAAPDLVVTDVMMPELDGFGLLQELRRRADRRHIPVVMLSARSGEDSRIEGLAAGADDYVVKPFSARELVARVRTQLELSRLRRDTTTQNERLLTLIQVAPAAIALLRGPDHVFELANEQYYELVGRRDLCGRPGREALPELNRQGIWDLVDRVHASGQPYVTREFRVEFDRLGAGRLEEGFVDFLLQPLADGHGRTEGILVHAVDVTEQVVARRRIDEARRAAEAANRAKDEFLAMLAHELRNPLAPILTALQLMTLRGNVGAEKERLVIDRQVRHVIRLVDDLLDVSRITRGMIELKRERTEMAPVIARAVETTSPLLEQKHQSLAIDVPDTGLTVDGDPTRLQQIVFNLLNNAAKYTEPGGRIEVHARRRDHDVEIRVRDTGIGIEPGMLPHVFDLFVQAPQAIDRSQGGLGLGLAIVRNLVLLHGGRVEARSDGRGCGSEFLIALPASTAAADEPLHAGPPPPLPEPLRDDIRVLIVDDNADAADLLAEALALAGFHTRTAADGPAALRVCEAFAPHVALLDLGLPVMDGYELAEHMQRLASRPALVAVTGYGSESDRHRAETSGFVEHFTKPVDVGALIGRIRQLVSASHASEPGSA